MHINNKKISKRREGGFTLLEVALAASLMSAASILAMTNKLSESELEQAKNVGVILQQYNDGAQRWAQDNPGVEKEDQSGSRWLKPTSCGGESSEAYLPCNFPDLTDDNPTRFGKLAVTSEISTTGVFPKHETRVTTKTTSFKSGRTDRNRPDLAGVAALTARAASTTGEIHSSVDNSKLTMIAGNVASTDPWLRTDGFNKMSSSIGFDESLDQSLRQVTGLSGISGIAGQVLSFGLLNEVVIDAEQVVIDADQDLYGKLSVFNKGDYVNAIEVEKGDINVISGGIKSSGDITSESELKGRKIVATTDISAPVFYDSRDASYKLELSRLSTFNATQIGILSVTSNATIHNATLSGNALVPNTGSFTPPLVSNMSAYCTRGMLGRNSDGEMLSCVSGKWNKGGGITDVSQFKPCLVGEDYNSIRLKQRTIISGNEFSHTPNHSTDNSYLCLDGKYYLIGSRGYANG